MAAVYLCSTTAAALAGAASPLASLQNLLLLGAAAAALTPGGAALSAVLLAAGAADWWPGAVLLAVRLCCMWGMRPLGAAWGWLAWLLALLLADPSFMLALLAFWVMHCKLQAGAHARLLVQLQPHSVSVCTGHVQVPIHVSMLVHLLQSVCLLCSQHNACIPCCTGACFHAGGAAQPATWQRPQQAQQ